MTTDYGCTAEYIMACDSTVMSDAEIPAADSAVLVELALVSDGAEACCTDVLMSESDAYCG